MSRHRLLTAAVIAAAVLGAVRSSATRPRNARAAAASDRRVPSP
jgi:hypothetical protein